MRRESLVNARIAAYTQKKEAWRQNKKRHSN